MVYLTHNNCSYVGLILPLIFELNFEISENKELAILVLEKCTS
jgi:hypothetical protein